jgi:hypothetical protein
MIIWVTFLYTVFRKRNNQKNNSKIQARKKAHWVFSCSLNRGTISIHTKFPKVARLQAPYCCEMRFKKWCGLREHVAFSGIIPHPVVVTKKRRPTQNRRFAKNQLFLFLWWCGSFLTLQKIQLKWSFETFFLSQKSNVQPFDIFLMTIFKLQTHNISG